MPVKSAGGKLATEASHPVIGYGTRTISILVPDQRQHSD